MNRNNQNFKRLCTALELTRADVFEIMDGEVSKSLIDGWQRSENATKHASGNSRASTVKRFRPMTDAHFDQFCEGLVTWTERHDDEI